MFKLTSSTETAIREPVRLRLIGRIGTRTFWTLLGVELVLLTLVAVWMFGLPSQTARPFAAEQDLTPVK